jgi:hypothetical protein
MRKFLGFIAIACWALGLVSCDNGGVGSVDPSAGSSSNHYVMAIDSSLGFSVGVRYNTLCFPTSHDVMTALRELPKLSTEQRRNWEKSIGFTSFQSLYEDAEAQIEADTSGVRFAQLVATNSHLLRAGAPGSFEVQPRVYGNYTYIVNNLGYFSNEVFANKVMDGNMYSAHYRLLPAIEAKYRETVFGTAIEGLEKFQVLVLPLDESPSVREKSAAIEGPSNNNQQVEVSLGNKQDDRNWTRKATFRIRLVNNYALGTAKWAKGEWRNFFVVYYFTGLNPADYGFLGSDFGGTTQWKEFVHIYGYTHGDDHWQIEVPYNGYFNDVPLSERPPLGDLETYYRAFVDAETGLAYESEINAHLYYEIRGRRRSRKPWGRRFNEVASVPNIVFQTQVEYVDADGVHTFDVSQGSGVCNNLRHAQFSDEAWIPLFYKSVVNRSFIPKAQFKKITGTLYYENHESDDHTYELNVEF